MTLMVRSAAMLVTTLTC
ncbi:hypothetical protein F383_32297 [Gossypium arboreum]|uniref:Uncharacterized protein n=1 Tax=Gossypium arboreum TaxID=29729 RepID=A0A0B0MZ44_GOSAR|nr:hypothetical protein F383_32297 [Gossypium arboreum]